MTRPAPMLSKPRDQRLAFLDAARGPATDKGDEDIWIGPASAVSRAICLAALRAIGEEV